MSRTFVACKSAVHNRGMPPESFLNEIVDWAIDGGQNCPGYLPSVIAHRRPQKS